MEFQMEASKCSLWEQAPRPPQDRPWFIFLDPITMATTLLDLWMPLPSSSWMFQHPFLEWTPSILPMTPPQLQGVEGC